MLDLFEEWTLALLEHAFLATPLLSNFLPEEETSDGQL